MPKQDKLPRLDDKQHEQVEISFLGFKFKCSSPSSKTIIILAIILTFLLVLVVLMPKLLQYDG
jgi:hypothetical protein